MRISIYHQTTYRYPQPVIGGIQYLRLTPSTSATQKVLRWNVKAPGRLTPWRDEHGNACHSVTMLGALSEITVIAEGEVETWGKDGIEPFGGADTLPKGSYLRQTAMTTPSEALVGFAEGYRAAIEADPISGLGHLLQAVAAAVTYREGVTEAETTAHEAFANGSGVCQDHAHIFLGCARHLRVPARYVSGYLANDAGDLGLHAASHAWAEAEVPGLGWVSYDPANACGADERYVRLAIGMDSIKAAPLRGVRHGGGGEDLDVQVRIQSQG